MGYTPYDHHRWDQHLAKVNPILLVVIIETLVASNGFTALSCCDFQGQRPKTVPSVKIVDKAEVIYLEDDGRWNSGYRRL